MEEEAASEVGPNGGGGGGRRGKKDAGEEEERSWRVPCLGNIYLRLLLTSSMSQTWPYSPGFVYGRLSRRQRTAEAESLERLDSSRRGRMKEDISC